MNSQSGKPETQENKNTLAKILPDGELTDQILAAAIRVHRQLGPGFLESIYEEALCLELEASKLTFERQKSVEVRYRDKVIGIHRLDLPGDSRVMVAVNAITGFGALHLSVDRA